MFNILLTLWIEFQRDDLSLRGTKELKLNGISSNRCFISDRKEFDMIYPIRFYNCVTLKEIKSFFQYIDSLLNTLKSIK